MLIFQQSEESDQPQNEKRMSWIEISQFALPANSFRSTQKQQRKYIAIINSTWKWSEAYAFGHAKFVQLPN